MARTNQGIFKKLICKYEIIKNEYEQVRKDYYSGGNWNGNGDFFSDFALPADRVYCMANDLADEISVMMNATKFEKKDIKEKYEKMLSESQEKARDIKNIFDETLESIKMIGGITDLEQRTLDRLRIYSLF